jgi:hypothetical protein
MIRKLFLAAFVVLLLPFASAQAGVTISFGFAPPPCRRCFLPLPRPYLSLIIGPACAAPAPVCVQPAPGPIVVQPAPVLPLPPPLPVSDPTLKR